MQQKTIHVRIRKPARVGSISSQHGQQGYVLLAVMLLITLMLIAMSVELPRIAQQVKRDKEEELVHRGTDYARAVKRYYHKFNSYPSSIEQLKDTNHIRFLRKEYKDPITGESEWKLVHAGEAEIKVPQQNGAVQGANPALTGGAGAAGQPTGAAGLNPNAGGVAGSGFSGGGTGLSAGTGLSGRSGLSGGGSGLSGGSTGLSGGGSGLSGGGTGLSGSTSTAPGQGSAATGGTAPQGGSGALQTSNIGLGNSGPQVGGGQIIGFASTSKKNSIKEFNDKNEYDQWYFVYDPRLEQVGPNQTGSANAGLIVAAPRVGSGAAQGAPGGLQGSQNPNGQNPRNQNPGNQNQGNQNPGNMSGAAPASTPTPQVPQ
jgi:type II secretory pathway pseudopilin PulG